MIGMFIALDHSFWLMEIPKVRDVIEVPVMRVPVSQAFEPMPIDIQTRMFQFKRVIHERDGEQRRFHIYEERTI